MYLITLTSLVARMLQGGQHRSILACSGRATNLRGMFMTAVYTRLQFEADLYREILAEIPISAPALREPRTAYSYPPPDEWTTHEEDSWYFFLSEIALRRLTDQVNETVSKYIDPKNPEASSISELIPLVAEFERQAEAFREHLPPATRFPDVPQPANTEWQQYTRGRYYRLLELMHRPFLFTALHESGTTPVVGKLAEKALLNALRYLQHSYISHRHHGTWLQLRNELKGASLLLAGSKSSMLNMPDGWELGVEKALATFDHWSKEFSPCLSYTNIILTLNDSQLNDIGEEVSMDHT